ncbi:MAG: HAMP domain-containing sensor histidine kinase [Candidatus Hydrogenedentota bacterium]
MKDTRVGTYGGQTPPERDRVVTEFKGDATSETAQSIAAARRQIADSIAAHRGHVAARWGSPATDAGRVSRERAREMLKASKARAKALLGQQTELQGSHGAALTAELPLEDCHTLELLLSHVRHSVVRVCFYNLKLFCPSLVDEYDEEVRDQVVANLAQLPRAREELESFFEQTLAGGSISHLFPVQHRDCFHAFSELAHLGDNTVGRLDDGTIRQMFAQRVPALIDDVMAPLAAIQESLDGRKVAPADLFREALSLCGEGLEQAGITVESDIQPTPRIFAHERGLLNSICELLTNAAKYSKAANLEVGLREKHEDGHWIEARVCDDGKGMTAEELAACRGRGFSTGGTGEGLSMVAHSIEQDHLGTLEIDATPGKGVCVVMRLPVRLDANMLTRQGD